MTAIPEGLVRSLAAQFYIDRKKHLDLINIDEAKKKENIELDLKWREEAAAWASLPEEDKEEFIEAARKYMTDWVSRYPRYSSIVLERWLEVDYNNP